MIYLITYNNEESSTSETTRIERFNDFCAASNRYNDIVQYGVEAWTKITLECAEAVHKVDERMNCK